MTQFALWPIILRQIGTRITECDRCMADWNELAAPANGHLSVTNVTHGKYVAVSCSSGFNLEENPIIVCFSGSLLGHIGICVLVLYMKISSHRYVSNAYCNCRIIMYSCSPCVCRLSVIPALFVSHKFVILK